MGSSASKPPIDTDVAEQVEMGTAKRKLEHVDLDWPGSDVEKTLDKKRKLEEAEPYNGAAVRQKAKEIGFANAMSSSLSEVSKVSQNVAPRGLSSEGDESSELVSADETGGVAVNEMEAKVDWSEDVIGSQSENESDGGENEGVSNGEEGEKLKIKPGGNHIRETATVEDAPPPISQCLIGRMNKEADEYVANLMKNYNSRPSQSQRQKSSSVNDDDDEDDEDDEDEEVDAEGGADEEEETQVVQDDMTLVPDAALTPLLVHRDSGHGSMEDSRAEMDSNDEDSETPGSALEQPQLDDSQDRMSAVKETVRQIKAERSAGAAIGSWLESEDHGEGASEREIVRAVSGLDDGEAREQYVADRKAGKKARKALARQGKQGQTVPTTIVPVVLPVPKSAPPPLAERITTVPPQAATDTQHEIQDSAKQTNHPAPIAETKFAIKRRTKSEKRRRKRERRAVERTRLARENPDAYVAKLKAKITVFVPELSEGADAEARREHKVAVRKSMRAALHLQQLREKVAKPAGETAAGELGLQVEA